MKPLSNLVQAVSNITKTANLKSQQMLNDAYLEHRKLTIKTPEQIRKEMKLWTSPED